MRGILLMALCRTEHIISVMGSVEQELRYSVSQDEKAEQKDILSYLSYLKKSTAASSAADSLLQTIFSADGIALKYFMSRPEVPKSGTALENFQKIALLAAHISLVQQVIAYSQGKIKKYKTKKLKKALNILLKKSENFFELSKTEVQALLFNRLLQIYKELSKDAKNDAPWMKTMNIKLMGLFSIICDYLIFKKEKIALFKTLLRGIEEIKEFILFNSWKEIVINKFKLAINAAPRGPQAIRLLELASLYLFEIKNNLTKADLIWLQESFNKQKANAKEYCKAFWKIAAGTNQKKLGRVFIIMMCGGWWYNSQKMMEVYHNYFQDKMRPLTPDHLKTAEELLGKANTFHWLMLITAGMIPVGITIEIIAEAVKNYLASPSQHFQFFKLNILPTPPWIEAQLKQLEPQEQHQELSIRL